jgi:glyoxylase-like metal-dependent hydrolase (beta-lactamase superfamily II)
MANTIFHSRQICRNTWVIQGDGCTSYLVVGDERGVMIDTGFAAEKVQHLESDANGAFEIRRVRRVNMKR